MPAAPRQGAMYAHAARELASEEPENQLKKGIPSSCKTGGFELYYRHIMEARWNPLSESTNSVKLGEIIREFDLEVLRPGPDYENVPLDRKSVV